VEAPRAGARLTPLRVYPTPESLGEALATRVLARVDEARRAGRQFLLGCPTGRTPRPIYDALLRRNADFSNVVLVMMDEYLVGDAYATVNSCHDFVQRQMAFHGLARDAVWFPSPDDPAEYDARIADAGGIDLFILASGAGDGHVAFNPPGTPPDSRTRIIDLSEQTRRDNLRTFPAFGTLDNVPRQGISVGIATITAAREAVMVAWGTDKRLTIERIVAASRYDPSWPATVIHECANAEIICDAAAAPSRSPAPPVAP
jgi:glucosamine-6-phosphate deaminase